MTGVQKLNKKVGPECDQNYSIVSIVYIVLKGWHRPWNDRDENEVLCEIMALAIFCCFGLDGPRGLLSSRL